MKHWIDNGDGVLVETDLLTWSRWFQNMDGGRRVAYDEIFPFEISTVCLGIDHGFWADRPVLYETMVFEKGSSEDRVCVRYCTRDEAVAGHALMVEHVKAGVYRLKGN